jgi:hypothetical protein
MENHVGLTVEQSHRMSFDIIERGAICRVWADRPRS